ncbi:MAG: hypothetical protein ACK5LJ_16560 [Paracoccus sp. (in: a-proteobacteria)]
MQIAYHVGVHGSDRDRIIRTLMRNRETLWPLGIQIPAPRRYAGIFGDAISALKKGAADEETQELLLASVMDSDHAERLILSQSGFIGMPPKAISHHGMYPRSADRLTGLSNLFPETVVEFFTGLVHPARQIDAVVRFCGGNYDEVMSGIDPRTLRWAPMVQRWLDAIPDRDIVIWAQEDLPFIWPELLRRMAGVPTETPLQGDDLILADILPEDTLRALKAEMTATPNLTAGQRRAMVERALTALDEVPAMEVELSLTNWSQSLVDELSDIYAEDLAEIAALPGVEFMSA